MLAGSVPFPWWKPEVPGQMRRTGTNCSRSMRACVCGERSLQPLSCSHSPAAPALQPLSCSPVLQSQPCSPCLAALQLLSCSPCPAAPVLQPCPTAPVPQPLPCSPAQLLPGTHTAGPVPLPPAPGAATSRHNSSGSRRTAAPSQMLPCTWALIRWHFPLTKELGILHGFHVRNVL